MTEILYRLIEWRKVFDSVFKEGTPVARQMEDACDYGDKWLDLIRSVRTSEFPDN